MSVQYKITLDNIPEADESYSYDNVTLEHTINRPEGLGWKLEYSVKGNYYIYHFWKKGSIIYDYGLQTYFTGKGDDITNQLIGDGSSLRIVTGTTQQDYTQDVEFIADQTYLFGGKASWSGTGSNDAISVHVVASATPVKTQSSGDVILNGDLIEPVSDNSGTHVIDGVKAVVPNNNNSGWWDIVDKTVVPNYNQEGIYDLYKIEKTISRLINHIYIDNNVDGYNELTNDNTWKVAPGHKFRLVAHNNSGNQWTVSFIMYMIRSKTSNI
ncbi:hypothetical protein PBI_SCTP2_160 [Salicola phage SCTP-2]|nr:hypothetical protein PBI_SCTP2_160 [Salicola phage SCTP-2]